MQNSEIFRYEKGDNASLLLIALEEEMRYSFKST
jgi:hypothetical protein